MAEEGLIGVDGGYGSFTERMKRADWGRSSICTRTRNPISSPNYCANQLNKKG